MTSAELLQEVKDSPQELFAVGQWEQFGFYCPLGAVAAKIGEMSHEDFHASWEDDVQEFVPLNDTYIEWIATALGTSNRAVTLFYKAYDAMFDARGSYYDRRIPILIDRDVAIDAIEEVLEEDLVQKNGLEYL